MFERIAVSLSKEIVVCFLPKFVGIISSVSKEIIVDIMSKFVGIGVSESTPFRASIVSFSLVVVEWTCS